MEPDKPLLFCGASFIMQIDLRSVSNDSFDKWLESLTMYQAPTISCYHPHDIITMKEAIWQLDRKEGKNKSRLRMFSRMWDNYRKNFRDWSFDKPHLLTMRREATKVISKRKIRTWLFNRDGFCLCCGSNESLTVDHIVPVSRGGKNSLSNFQTLCRSCNSRKGTKYIDFRWAIQRNHSFFMPTWFAAWKNWTTSKGVSCSC